MNEWEKECNPEGKEDLSIEERFEYTECLRRYAARQRRKTMVYLFVGLAAVSMLKAGAK